MRLVLKLTIVFRLMLDQVILLFDVILLEVFISQNCLTYVLGLFLFQERLVVIVNLFFVFKFGFLVIQKLRFQF